MANSWNCNNCGHGEKNRPERVCNCKCHEAYDAGRDAARADAIEECAKIAEEREKHYDLGISAKLRSLSRKQEEPR